MFKNEAPVIRRMLESCAPYMDCAVIQNNGSTDGTDQIVKDFFNEKQIPCYLYNVEEGWVGFGWNRDHLIRTCQSLEHGCDWILKMDCDEVLEVDSDFDWSILDNKNTQAFHVPAVMGTSVYFRAWMYNAKLPWGFNHDPCHETVYCDIEGVKENFQITNLPLGFRQIGYNEGQSWSNPTKFISDSLILEEKMIKEGNMLDNLYHFWYIGKSYYDAYHEHSFPLGKSHQDHFAKRSIYYFDEYLNTVKAEGTINEMCYLALQFIGDSYRFLGEIDRAIVAYNKATPYAPERNDSYWSLAWIYHDQQDWSSMYGMTSILMQPNRKNVFPNYCVMIDTSIYNDSPTGKVQELHKIATDNYNNGNREVPSTFFINNYSSKKLFVVDNFYLFPDDIRSFALKQDYKEDLRFYKGLRSTKIFHPPGIKRAFEQIIGEDIRDFPLSGINGCFQITTANDPQVYHHDLQKWAAMIYLTPGAPVESGTRLHRSKINGTMHMDDANSQQAFTSGFYDGTKFETIADASNLYNRLVIMDAKNFHSAGSYFGQGKEDGRLTHLFFFD